MQKAVDGKMNGEAIDGDRSPAPMRDFFGSKRFLCDSKCVICNKLNKRLDYSPCFLVNELTGELKKVPTFATQAYLNKWSLWHELPSSETKRLLEKEKQPRRKHSISVPPLSHSPDSSLISQTSDSSNCSILGSENGSVDANNGALKTLC